MPDSRSVLKVAIVIPTKDNCPAKYEHSCGKEAVTPVTEFGLTLYKHICNDRKDIDF